MSIAADVFTGGMVHRAVASERLSYLPIDPAFIGAEMRVGRERFCDDRLHRLGRDTSHTEMEGADLALTLNKRHNRFLRWRLFECAVSRFAANIGFVRFDKFAFTAHAGRKLCFAHSFANAHRHEPRCPVGPETERAPELISRHSLFA